VIINPPADEGVALVVNKPHSATSSDEENKAAKSRYFDCLERFG
jgi:hypothetical protein